MPVYVYKCETCGKVVERALRLSECHVPQACPTCDTNINTLVHMTRQPTSASLSFKGAGWTPKHY